MNKKLLSFLYILFVGLLIHPLRAMKRKPFNILVPIVDSSEYVYLDRMPEQCNPDEQFLEAALKGDICFLQHIVENEKLLDKISFKTVRKVFLSETNNIKTQEFLLKQENFFRKFYKEILRNIKEMFLQAARESRIPLIFVVARDNRLLKHIDYDTAFFSLSYLASNGHANTIRFLLGNQAFIKRLDGKIMKVYGQMIEKSRQYNQQKTLRFLFNHSNLDHKFIADHLDITLLVYAKRKDEDMVLFVLKKIQELNVEAMLNRWTMQKVEKGLLQWKFRKHPIRILFEEINKKQQEALKVEKEESFKELDAVEILGLKKEDAREELKKESRLKKEVKEVVAMLKNLKIGNLLKK